MCANARRAAPLGVMVVVAMLWRVRKAEDSLQVRFWGVRGSACASGPDFVEFGGHTACVEIRCGTRLFVVDAGSGLAALGADLVGNAPQTVEILLSHLHLDHVQGLPFFKPSLLGDRTIRTYCGNLDGRSAAEALDRLFSPPLFPIRLDEFPCAFDHRGFRAGETIGFADGASVETHPLQHPDGATGYRFTHGGRVVCYISDIEHSEPWPRPALSRFVANADLVIYDGMFSDDEYPHCRGWGHSTWRKGVELCNSAGARSLAIVHLHPAHDDTRLRRMEAEMQAVMPSAFIARERQALALEPVSGTP